MAENESLDVGNRRFKWVVSDLLRGRPASEIADRLLKKLCGTWNYVRRHGFDVVNIVGLAGMGGDLDTAIRDTGGSDLAHLIRVHARPMGLPAAVLDAVNRAAIEQVVDSGLQTAICYDGGPTILEASHIKRQILAVTGPVISLVTDSLLGGPSTRVRAPKLPPAVRPVPNVVIPISTALLTQSLRPQIHRSNAGA